LAGLAWSENPECYASGRVATGWGSHAGQVKGDDPDKKGYPGPPGWGLGVGLTTPPCKTWIWLETSAEASEEEAGLGGHGPKTGRIATEEEEGFNTDKSTTKNKLSYVFYRAETVLKCSNNIKISD
jgi:hypothetical protein